MTCANGDFLASFSGYDLTSPGDACVIMVTRNKRSACAQTCTQWHFATRPPVCTMLNKSKWSNWSYKIYCGQIRTMYFNWIGLIRVQIRKLVINGLFHSLKWRKEINIIMLSSMAGVNLFFPLYFRDNN